MFKQSKPIVFDRYSQRRPRRIAPRWLVLLLVGSAMGAGCVVLVQEQFLVPRVPIDTVNQLQHSLEQSQSEQLLLKGELHAAVTRLESVLADKKQVDDELIASRENFLHLREDMNSLVALLPPSPNASTIEVRAARFTVAGATLAYDILLSRKSATSKPMTGVMQLVLTGEPHRGSTNTITMKPVPISVSKYQSLRNVLPLPEGFKPRKSVIQVLDRINGKLIGRREMSVG